MNIDSTTLVRSFFRQHHEFRVFVEDLPDARVTIQFKGRLSLAEREFVQFSCDYLNKMENWAKFLTALHKFYFSRSSLEPVKMSFLLFLLLLSLKAFVSRDQ